MSLYRSSIILGLPMRHLQKLAIVTIVLVTAFNALADDAKRPCGLSPNDWCISENDPCWVHKDKESCQADPNCEGLPYRGESVVACKFDARCFASNCPSVGCVTPCDTLTKKRCEEESSHCKWSEKKCERIMACNK